MLISSPDFPRRRDSRCTGNSLCDRCRADQQFLRSRDRRPVTAGAALIRVADLFCGCGGMSIGLAEAASRAGYRFEVALAADSEPAAIRIYQSNLPKAEARVARIEEIFEGAVGAPLTNSENEIAGAVGPVDLLLGGPPCQGHSDLNNHTRRRDPKNALYLRMARAAEVLAPKVVVIENVTPVQWDESGVLKATFEALIASGYQAAGRVLDLRRVGVPQRRRRFVLIASRLATVDPKNVLDHLADATPGHQDRTVRWAIEDLINCNLATVYDTASQTSKENAKRIRFLFEKRLYDLPNENRPKCHRDRVHSYVSMYGRLHWNEPAQTITTGFGSMGQGRYVHPQRRRTITPHEAARLQTFPDWFDFGEKTPRGVIAQAIGNAVPPLLMLELGNLVLPALSCPPDVERLQA